MQVSAGVGNDPPVARQPQRHGQLVGLAGGRRDALGGDRREPGVGEKAGDFLLGEAEPAMSVGLAQKFLAMGGEVDHQQPARRPQRPRRFGQRARRIVEKMQHLVDDDEVVGIALDRRRIEVALAQLDVAQAALADARARNRKHRRALIDADGAIGARREQFEHAAGPRAEIEQAANRPVADHRQDRRLDPALRRVQRADRVPVGGALGEIGRRLLAPRFARRRQPGAVGGEGRVGGIDAGDERARQRAAGVGEPIERPGAFALALGEAGFDQQFQMPRHARLRLAENGDELADRQLGFAEQADQPEARHLARRLQAGEQGVEAQRQRPWRTARR